MIVRMKDKSIADDPVGGIDGHQGSILVDAVRQVRRDIAGDF
jgi:hypothetical protein